MVCEVYNIGTLVIISNARNNQHTISSILQQQIAYQPNTDLVLVPEELRDLQQPSQLRRFSNDYHWRESIEAAGEHAPIKT